MSTSEPTVITDELRCFIGVESKRFCQNSEFGQNSIVPHDLPSKK